MPLSPTAVLRAMAASFAATAAASAVLNQRSFSTWCIVIVVRGAWHALR